MSEWISVEDRLPEYVRESAGCACSAPVLLWAHGVYVPDIAIYWEDGTWSEFHSGKLIKGKNVHWMRLPEPPQEVGTDE